MGRRVRKRLKISPLVFSVHLSLLLKARVHATLDTYARQAPASSVLTVLSSVSPHGASVSQWMAP